MAIRWQSVGNALAIRWQSVGNPLASIGNPFASIGKNWQVLASENRESGVTDGHREGGRERKTCIDLEWLAPLKISSKKPSIFLSF